MTAVTGVPLRVEGLLALGRQRLARQQEISDLLGLPAATLPDRFYDEPVRHGPFQRAVLDRKEHEAAVAALQDLRRAC